jgi:hypothetical protein
MKKLLLAAIAAAVFAPTAFAQEADISPLKGQQVPRNVYGQEQQRPQPNDVFGVNGAYLGSDPDPNIRVQILRDATGTGDVAPE